MIQSFSHKGLKRFFGTESLRGIQADHKDRLRLILTNLNVATQPRNMDLPGYKLHPLKGKRKGEWAVSVSGAWRVTFSFDGGDVANVNYEEYH